MRCELSRELSFLELLMLFIYILIVSMVLFIRVFILVLWVMSGN